MSTIQVKVAALTLGLGLATGSVLAQTLEEVKVEAFRSVGTKAAGRSVSGVPILDLSLSYGVSLADLDLSTASGARTAEERVNRAAQAACKEIGRQYPNATPRKNLLPPGARWDNASGRMQRRWRRCRAHLE